MYFFPTVLWWYFSASLYFLFAVCVFFLMNIICSIISLRILKFFLVVSILFIWHESVSGVLMLLLPSSVLVFMYSGILVYKFISRFSLSLLWFPQPAENRLPRLPSVSPIPPSSTWPLSLYKFPFIYLLSRSYTSLCLVCAGLTPLTPGLELENLWPPFIFLKLSQWPGQSPKQFYCREWRVSYTYSTVTVNLQRWAPGVRRSAAALGKALSASICLRVDRLHVQNSPKQKQQPSTMNLTQ